MDRTVWISKFEKAFGCLIPSLPDNLKAKSNWKGSSINAARLSGSRQRSAFKLNRARYLGRTETTKSVLEIRPIRPRIKPIRTDSIESELILKFRNWIMAHNLRVDLESHNLRLNYDSRRVHSPTSNLPCTQCVLHCVYYTVCTAERFHLILKSPEKANAFQQMFHWI